MTKQTIVALGAALIFVGRTLAQPPSEAALLPAPAPIEGPPPAPAVMVPEPAPARSGERFWATSEYLFGWMYGTNLPPLVTTSPAGTARTAAGVLGSPTTSILFGGDRVDDSVRSGLRFGMGYWFDRGRGLDLGVEAGFTILESQSSIFSASSSGTPILARPFFSALNGTAQSVLIAFPGSSSGAVDARSSSGNYYDLNLDLAQRLWDDGWLRLDGLLGYRFFRYDEGLRIQQSISPTGGNFVAGTQIATIDDFVTHNEFHGGELGARANFRWESLSLGLLGKLAVGSVDRQSAINGGQNISVPGAAPVVQTGGVLALSSNIGTRHKDEWTILPEFGFDLAWHVNSSLALRLGYSVLFLERITHAADLVDLTVNPNLFPMSTTAGGASRPAFTPSRADIWVQTLNVGVEFTY